jgi:hypothetical protein
MEGTEYFSFLFSFIKGGATEKAHKFLTSVTVKSGTLKELVVSVLSEHCKTVQRFVPYSK